MIDKFCRETFLIPYKISELSVIMTIVQPSEVQHFKTEGFWFSLVLKKFEKFYLLALIDISEEMIVVRECYKIFQDLVQRGKQEQYYLLQILEDFYIKVGIEFNFAGKKSKFLYDYCCIGIPETKLSDAEILKDFLRIGQNESEFLKFFFRPHFRKMKGNFIDYIHVQLMCVMNTKKYQDYIITNT